MVHTVELLGLGSRVVRDLRAMMDSVAQSARYTRSQINAPSPYSCPNQRGRVRLSGEDIRMLKTFIVCALALIGLGYGAPATAADDTRLSALMTAHEARGWEGVGRLNIGAGGMCTGALIAPRLVLTAGHCLYDQFTGEAVDPSSITFLAGWRNGRASAYRNVRRAVIHPDYEYSGPSGALRVSNDLALLELESDIRLAHIRPFGTGGRPRKGAAVGVVSYAHDRAETLSLQEVCHVLARQSGALVLSCEVDFGSSGAPIFAEVDGEPRIVSVVSAKAMVQGRKVSLGTDLERPLHDLIALLEGGQGLGSGSKANPPHHAGRQRGGVKRRFEWRSEVRQTVRRLTVGSRDSAFSRHAHGPVHCCHPSRES